MKKNTLYFFLLVSLFWSATSWAQEGEYNKYNWVESPTIHTLNAEEKAMDKIVLKEKMAYEYLYDPSGNLSEQILSHTITRVNSDKVIQENNRIYIPSGTNLNYLIHKVRVINPDGKVKELSNKDIKEAVDEKSKATYRFFALEGLELGSEIEHLYLLQLTPNYGGKRELIQEDILKKNIEFELISPTNLVFKIKSYNNLAEVTLDTSRKDKNVYRLNVAKIDALKDEAVSTYSAQLQQLIFKLDANKASGTKDIISYGSVSNNIYNNICNAADKADLKKVKKLIQQINLKNATDEKSKITAIEQYLKTNIMVIENNNPIFSTIGNILDNKVGNDDGMMKLYSAIFNELAINYQIVLTSNREKLKFDPEFEAYNFLEAYLIYFPEIDSYLSPSELSSCLGYIPFNLSANHGLFIKKVALNNFNTGIGKINFIKPVPYDKNFSNHFVKVDFSEDISNPLIECQNEMGGYYAQYYQPYYNIMPEDDKKKLNESLVYGFIENAEIKDVKIENGGREYFGEKPFVVKASLTSENLVEKAGNKYLFKVGDLIGPQMEMYQDKERKLEIENDFMRLYKRSITFELPAGYKISNPETLKMDVFFTEEGEKTIAFTSDYKVEGNNYIIDVEEYYKKLTFPLSQYENYRKVINAAADFNKITLVIEKL
mgnify:CR=1 FL=1